MSLHPWRDWVVDLMIFHAELLADITRASVVMVGITLISLVIFGIDRWISIVPGVICGAILAVAYGAWRRSRRVDDGL